MNIIITMAGQGRRFKEAGYQMPKYMIEARGRTLFEWSMDSLLDYNPHTGKYIFVVRRGEGAREFIRDHCRAYGLREVLILELEAPTDGQATTCMKALPHCDPGEGIMIYNIDTYVEPGHMKFADLKGEGHIPCFCAKGDHWSFVKTNENGRAVEVREKKRISNQCSLGAYYFSSAALFENLYQEYYEKTGRLENNERYIAPLYNIMIEKGMEVTVSMVDSRYVHVLGTPQELEEFLR